MADSYEIDTITPTRRFTPGKPTTPAYEVAFLTRPSGIAGAVLVDAETFTEDAVAAAVKPVADMLERVKAM